MVDLGIPVLEKAFKGGLDTGKIILIKSIPGTGKIVMGYKFLESGLAQGENCFYFFHKENTKDAIREIENYGMPSDKIKFINGNMVYDNTNGPNVVIGDINNPASIDLLDDLFQTGKPARGVITIISFLFSKGLFSIAYYLLNHIRNLIDHNPKWLFLLTIEQGTISEKEMHETEKIVDVCIELKEKSPGKGDLIIYKSYKSLIQKAFRYEIRKNEFIVT